LIGASVRAAAYSARRAGIKTEAFDLYADLDLQAVSTTTRLDPSRGFQDLPVALGSHSGSTRPPVLWTGPLENEPAILEHLAAGYELLGTDPVRLRCARDPLQLASVLQDAEIPALRVAADARKVPTNGTWIRKPLASGGGRDIVRWTGQTPLREPHYFQEGAVGTPLAAIFLASSRSTELVDITRQRLDAQGFAYRGTVGPWPVDTIVRERLASMGSLLAERFTLRGLFGIDFVLDRDTPWLVELNPRYTAAVEVLELALGRSLLAEWFGLPDSQPGRIRGSHAPVVGKAILVTRRFFSMPAIPEAWYRLDDAWGMPKIADVTPEGVEIPAGGPVMSIFTAGSDPAECEQRLRCASGQWWTSLRRAAGGRAIAPAGTCTG
jgi:predicted ATP-grasp superfamily ATP-dependent carboligase